jgi:hypothetical protein
MVSAKLEGSVAALTRLNFAWQDVGGDPPNDVAGAMTARGASVTPIGCYHYGPSEVNRVFIVDAPGRAPFALTTYTRAAPLVYSHADQTIQADLSGKLPTLPGLQAEHTDHGAKVLMGAQAAPGFGIAALAHPSARC